jgi:hypothetical protein
MKKIKSGFGDSVSISAVQNYLKFRVENKKEDFEFWFCMKPKQVQKLIKSLEESLNAFR